MKHSMCDGKPCPLDGITVTMEIRLEGILTWWEIFWIRLIDLGWPTLNDLISAGSPDWIQRRRRAELNICLSLLPDWRCMCPTASYPSHHSPDCEPTWTLPSSGSFSRVFARAMRQVAEAICYLCSHDCFISWWKCWIFFFRIRWSWILLSYGILN